MINSYMQNFTAVLNATTITDRGGQVLDHDSAYQQVIDMMLSKKETSTLYLVGNGGSSGIISHAGIDFLNANGFRAHALTDNSLLTCMANDYGYENVFRQPLKTLLRPGDMVLGVSSSGKSPNIVNACQYAADNGATVITLSGFKSDNPLRKTGDYNFWIDATNYGVVEIGHSLLIHIINDELMKHHSKP